MLLTFLSVLRASSLTDNLIIDHLNKKIKGGVAKFRAPPT